jgi:hypothetical protein
MKISQHIMTLHLGDISKRIAIRTIHVCSKLIVIIRPVMSIGKEWLIQQTITSFIMLK